MKSSPKPTIDESREKAFAIKGAKYFATGSTHDEFSPPQFGLTNDRLPAVRPFAEKKF